MKKLLLMLVLLCTMANSTWADLTPRSGDTWDSTTKTLTVNSNPTYETYMNKADIVNLIISSSVTSIGDMAFMGCTKLTSITFAEGSHLSTIGLNAFMGCTRLTILTIPGSVTTIKDGAFMNCTGLTTITINHNSNGTATNIEPNAFTGCTKLTALNLNNNVSDWGFQDCTYLTTVNIGSGVTSISDRTFYGCNAVTDVYCYADPTKLTWESPSYDFSSGTKFHVADVSVWQTNFSSAKVTFQPHQAATNSANGAYWSTYYNTMAHMKADDNTTVYKAAIDGTNIVLTQISDKVITAGQAVVLRRNVEGAVTLTPQSTASTADYSDNQLRGTDVALAQEDGYTYYVLSKKSDNFGFFKLNPTTQLGANKAFLKVGANAAREFYGFDMDVTGVTNTKQTNFTNANSQYYDLQGRKVVKPEKGLYIVNGKKYVVK